MGNQQLDTLAVSILCKNAAVGDGYFWKHPECRNFKVIFTSTTPELLEVKQQLCPELFKTGVKLYRGANAPGCFKNAKALYRLASVVHPMITEYKHISAYAVIRQLDAFDLALWYLDDGSFIKRTESNSYRFYMAVGKLLSGYQEKSAFEERIMELFNTDTPGAIVPNNSNASENNLTWLIPVSIANKMLSTAARFGVLKHKFPPGFSSETIPQGSRDAD
jgi:hypothetical protein